MCRASPPAPLRTPTPRTANATTTDHELVEQVVEWVVASIEREAQKADVIADGATLYDADFHRINPQTRKPDNDDNDDSGAFVAYPDGSRC